MRVEPMTRTVLTGGVRIAVAALGLSFAACAPLHNLPEVCQSSYDSCLDGCATARRRPPRPNAVSDAMLPGTAMDEGDSGDCVDKCNTRAKDCARK